MEIRKRNIFTEMGGSGVEFLVRQKELPYRQMQEWRICFF